MIFCSVLTYDLGRAMGVEHAAAEFERQAQAKPGEPRLPAASVVSLLRDMDDVMLYHPFGTRLPQLRSRCAHAAWESKADVWVMVDDDVGADAEALRAIVDVARSLSAPVVVLPCVVRGTALERRRVNVQFKGSLVLRMGGHSVREIDSGGCGLMAVPRRALERVRKTSIALPYRDDDGKEKLALFHQSFDHDRWLGEDISFCRRLEAVGVQMVAPCEGHSYHAGVPLWLGGEP